MTGWRGAGRRGWPGLLLLVVLLSGLLPAPSPAAEVGQLPWQITADRVETRRNPDRLLAEGNVQLRPASGTDSRVLEVRADRLEYDLEKGVVEASGNIVIRSAEDEVRAEGARIDLQSQTGTINSTTLYFEKNQLYFTGGLFEKTGPQSYRFKDGVVSACRREEGRARPWALASSEGRITIDGYAVLKHTTFRIKDVPVLYTPYLLFPAKITRQSGLLFPEISSSGRDGLGFLQPLFINLSGSADLTVYGGYLDKRGAVLAGEARYVLDYDSRGTLLANYLKDRTSDTVTDDFLDDGILRDLHDRYWYRGKFDQRVGDGLFARLDLDLVSDVDYLREYRQGMIGFRAGNGEFVETFHRGLLEESISFRESTLQLAKGWDAAFLGGELRGVDDVAAPVGPATEMQTLPRLLSSLRLASERLPLQLAWDAEYVNYWREEGVGGQRFDLAPRLVTPLPLGRFLEGKVSAGVRHTIYRLDVHGDESLFSWPASRDQERTMLVAGADLATMLTRDFGGRDGGPILTHTLRPSIGYDFGEITQEGMLPDFDGDDRVAAENRVTYGISNYFSLMRRKEDGSLADRDLGWFKISQGYDLTEARRELLSPADQRRPYSNVEFDLFLAPLEGASLRYLTELNVYGQGVPSYDLQLRFSDKRGDSLAADYRYVRGISHQLNLKAGLALTPQLTLQGGTTRSLFTDETVESTAGIIYHPHCWGVELRYVTSTDDQRFMLVFQLDGVGKALEFGKSNL